MQRAIEADARAEHECGNGSGSASHLSIGSEAAPDSFRIVVASTFTADPVVRPLQFWLHSLAIEGEVTLAPYAQVMQELLSPTSLLARNTRGCDVLLLRLADWIRDSGAEDPEVALANVRKAASDLISAVRSLRSRSGAPLIFFFCPAPASLSASQLRVLQDVEAELVRQLSGLPRTWCRSHADLTRLYPVTEHEDPRSDLLGHIPYTDEYFVAIGTMLARHIAALSKPQYKVIALDCDNTLWSGVCGEDGPHGVQITPAHVQLQEMLVRQHDAGMLLCLCSKNNERDVAAVFEAHPEMRLRPEHFVASRVNWVAKSTNLNELAAELGLSVDSFIFIDDSALECAEVQAHCPSVLTLTLPATPEGVAHLLDHAWALDRMSVTDEARHRTRQYKENRARLLAREGAKDLEQFLASLELQVVISPMQPDDLARVAELIQRTNQFNLTGLRRKASEIEALWSAEKLRILVVRVRDRFGEYGLVGTVFYRQRASGLEVDTFALSCRALGRRVEHRITDELATIARKMGLMHIVLKCRHTQQNAPARDFLAESFSEYQIARGKTDPANETVFRIPADAARPVANAVGRTPAAENPSEDIAVRDGAGSSRAWHDVAFKLSRLPDIMEAIASWAPQRSRAASAECVPPRTALEAAVAEIWADLLEVDRIGVHDDFFELGGDSLAAVRLIARMGSVLGLQMSLREFFESPSIEAVAATLSNTATQVEAIPRGASTERAPLSRAQQRLWFIDQFEGASRAYHIPWAIRLRGRLDVGALRSALDTLLVRHQALRTVFSEVDGEPVQTVGPIACFSLSHVSLGGGAEEIEAEVQRHSREEFTSGFDLRTGPLIRGRLLRLAADDHVLLLTMHHIVSDGWSMGILARELGALYSAYRSGSPDPLPVLPLQYTDYARWQREKFPQSELQSQLDYWKKHLQGAPVLLELPTDRQRPAVQTYRGASVELTLEPELTTALKSFSRRSGLTVAMTLHAAWVVLLHRLSGQEDIVVGVPVANRRRTELEGLIGFFVNTLPVRVRVEGGAQISELLHEVKRALLAAYENQDVSFEKVVEATQPVRSMSHSPMFQAMFVMQNASPSTLQCAGLVAEERRVSLETAQFDLTLSLQHSAEAMIGSISYASDLFDEQTVTRWSQLFKTLLEGMLRDQTFEVARLPLMRSEELQQIVAGFNTYANYEQSRTLHERFEEQAARVPDSVVVVHEGESITYAELNSRSNQLAHYLRDKGVGPDRLVALYAERGIPMIVGILGILKAGGAYVPLDSSYPPERLAYMVGDAAPAVILSQQHLKHKLPEMSADIVALDTNWDRIAQYPTENIDVRKAGIRGNHLAYVIYTSGSTGKPKGVMVEHRNVTRLFDATDEWFGFNERDVWTLFHSIAFDFSVWELWGALLYGGRLVVVPYLTARSPRNFYQLLCAEKVTVLNQTPSAFAQLIEAQRGCADEHALRVVIFGGEALELRMLRLWVARNGAERPRLVNMYGITETTVHVTYHPLSAAEIEFERGNPVGRPVPDLQAYVLDGHMQPAPVGVVGELYVGGAGVARGYLNREELTIQRFQKDPFSPLGHARMYRTGDLGRWRANGTLQYLGRNDHQVKIRGFRIELGEIEAQLMRHDQVKEAVVIAREDIPGEKRLVAYVVAKHLGEVPNVESLRASLKTTLPEYMAPSAFVLLSQMPLTTNGKLDRRALPAPDLGAYGSRKYETPRGQVERVLADIWQDLLRVERVGRRDNFFELGGHSLLIVQMLERLRSAGLSTQVRAVFEKSTLADLASALTPAAVDQVAAPPSLIPEGCEAITPDMLPLVQLEPQHIEQIVQTVPGSAANVEDIYPLAPLQEGILFHHLLDRKGSDTYVVSTLFSVCSQQRLQELIAALQGVIDRYDILRTAVLWEDLPRPVQVVYRKATLPVEELLLDRDRDALEQTRTWLEPERQRVDLRLAPLMRLLVARDPRSEQWYGLLQFHHIVGDDTSQGIINSELVAHLEGRALTIPLFVPYRHHVAQALAYAQKPEAEAFFRSKLADVDEPTAPFGLTDVHAEGAEINEAHDELGPHLASRIRAQARASGVSPATLFHAAWGLVISLTSGRDDVVFGSVLLGRMQGSVAAQRMGMFINTLPLRLRLSGVSTKDLVEQTQRELAELLVHEQTPLAVAQRCSGIPGSAPLFTALLNYRHRAVNPQAEWSAAAGINVLAIKDGTNYPIALSVDDLENGFVIKAQTDRRIDARRVTAYLHTALDSLVGALERSTQTPALALDVLPASERRQVLELLNATDAPYPREKLVHLVFEEQVELTPEAVAVEFEGRALIYTHLNHRANQLARYLRQKGVGPDSLVGICLDRSLDWVVGILGILKAGGAYVPLDPNYPQERMAYLMADAELPLVLIQESLRCCVPAGAAELIDIDSALKEIAECSAENLDPREIGLRSDHLAYVIYTSGSTGYPKGAMITHRDVLNLWQGLERVYEKSASCQRIGLNASFNFDASVQQLVGLLSGRTIVLVPQSVRRDASLMLTFIERNNIAGIDCTPSQLKAWVYAGLLASQASPLRMVLVGGEAIDLELWSNLAQAQVDFFNVYGPTECTVDSTVAHLNGDATTPHIGSGMVNRHIYILDRHRRPVPIGVEGEIYIGGEGVGRGYLKRPELTAERFVCDPLSRSPQARMYRTGDLGRWREDGRIEYLGRNDDQVKIRGFRIELGEIEAQLVRHAQVKQAVVIAREDVRGDQRLVAYVVPSDGSTPPSLEALRTHLKAVLPEYMVPSSFVSLETIPLTPSGKLDRRSFMAPELDAYTSRQFEAPQGEIEEILAGIWQELLSVGRVGRHDNFFELGGHSLMIVQMMERLRRIGLAVPVRSVFESPTLADLASALERGVKDEAEDVPQNLIPEDAEVIRPDMLPLIELSEQQILQICERIPGGARNIQDVYPLAPLQEGILFHHLLKQDGGDAYVVPTSLEISSREKLEELIAALQSAVDRHDVLRTAVLWEELPQPVQVVCRRAVLPVQRIELDARRNTLEQVREWLEPSRQRMDLRQAPLIQLLVAQEPRGERWYVRLTLHHIVGDNTSQEIVFSEVAAFMQGRIKEIPASLPYRNHVAQALVHARRHDAEAFFRSKFGDVDEPTAPFGLLDVHSDGSRIEEAREELETSLAERVRQQARRLGVSTATLFHAAWGLVVSRASGREDVVFGSVLLGRLQGSAGAQRILGMFINTLPMRLRLDGVSSQELVEQTQRELIELLSYEQASLALARRCSAIPGSAPLFSALLNYRQSGVDLRSGLAEVSGVQVLEGVNRTNYPITLSVDDSKAGFTLVAQTDRGTEPRRVTAYLRQALESLVDALEYDPRTPALILEVIPAPERKQITAFNDTEIEYPRGKLIHELFEEQAARVPNVIAVVKGNEQLTYAQLNEKADQLARYLMARGVGPDKLVGVLAERSPHMVVGLLGILKAGGAYMPLDPNYPRERLEFMLADAAPCVVLSQRVLAGLLPEEGVERFDLDAIILEPASAASSELADVRPARDPENLVYVIYTSGSTGKPKGTAMPHRSMVNLIEWHRRVLPAEGQRVLQFAALSFDVAFQEVFSTLCTGGTLVLLDEWVRREPGVLSEFLGDFSVHRLFIPPLMLQSLAEHFGARGSIPATLRDVITAGEQLRISPEIVGFFEQLGTCRLHNHYGPTETHVVTALTLAGEPRTWPVFPSIGRPVPNTQIHLLGACKQRVPIGVAGEIHIGGTAVARGYLGRTDLTEQRFVPGPAGDGRVYRTGDLGRWNADGSLEYLGRNDDQVKMRGYRIELGEIESRLASHPDVKEAVVVARGDSPGNRRLVAYTTLHAPRRVSAQELRAYLGAVLPDYMVPSAFVTLDAMPVTPSGKLNRRGLPAPELDAYASHAYESPEGDMEQRLAELWRDLLRVERVGRQDNFFDLGGHSLLAMQLVVRVQSLLSISAYVKLIFEFPTLAQLAAQLTEIRESVLLETLSRGGNEIDELLEQVANMSETNVRELTRELRVQDV